MSDGHTPEKNYFELFQLPVSLRVDKTLLRKNYLLLSRQVHPDYFVQQGEEAQKESLETSAALNKGLKVLSVTDETIRYVLMQKGLMQEEEKYSLPQDFLMEMLELNEEAEEATGDDETNAVKQKITNLETQIYEPVASIVENYQDGTTTEKELLQVKDYYFKKKYLERLYFQLAQKP